MCGIAGYHDASSPKEENLKRIGIDMGDAISHRGPDDSGIWIDNKFGLVFSHKRLSIIDLSSQGHQPMISDSGRFVITFNGEIYNHTLMRREIERCNSFVKWKGHSDTESLLKAIDTWGIDKTLKICTGMFAFALWDRKEKLLLLARDRFGEKPLYYGNLSIGNSSKYIFAFSSELNAIRAIPNVNLEINPSSLSSYFNFGYIKQPKSIYKGLRQLPPGSYLKIRLKNNSCEPVNIKEPIIWWDSKKIFFNIKDSLINEPEKDEKSTINELEKIIESSIINQSFSDVPTGTFLSGGIDSSLVTCLLQKSKSEKINTFTISFPDQTGYESFFNEGPHAQKIASYIGTNHIDIPVTYKEAQSIIPNLPKLYSEPFADSSQIPTYLLCNESRKLGLKVALTGDGGDEFFGGYNRHKFIKNFLSILKLSPNIFFDISANIIENFPISDKGLLRNKRDKIVSALKSADSLRSIYLELVSTGLQSSDLIKNMIKEDFPELSFLYSIDNLTTEKIMLADLINYLPSDILVKTDRASMAVGMETRSPFLDYKVAEFAWKMSSNLKIKRDGFKQIGKYPLRKILEKYIPSKIFNKPKAGFAIPIGFWLKGELKSWANDLLSQESLKNQDFLNYQFVSNIWNQHLKGEKDNTSKLWTILMWQSWYNEWK